MGKSSVDAPMLLGIVGILLAFMMPLLGIVAGVLAIILARDAEAKDKAAKKRAKITIILGVIAVVLSVITLLILFWMMGLFESTRYEMRGSIDELEWDLEEYCSFFFPLACHWVYYSILS